jgi:hypothetical protein
VREKCPRCSRRNEHNATKCVENLLQDFRSAQKTMERAKRQLQSFGAQGLFSVQVKVALQEMGVRG